MWLTLLVLRLPRQILTGETRTIAKAPERPQVVVKKVQVKSIDRSIAQLRAKQAAAAAGGSGSKTTVLQGSPTHAQSNTAAVVEPLLNDAVRFALGPENANVLQADAEREDIARAFMERVDSAQPLDPALATRILQDAFGSQVAGCAEAAVANPREFHRAFHLLSIPLRLRAGAVFDAACSVLTSFGDACAKLDASGAKSLFLDLALGVVVRVAGNLQASEERQLLRVCASFVGHSPQDRLELLKLCRDTLYARNDAVLVGILAAAAEELESPNSPPTGELLELYTLYCKGGLTSSAQQGSSNQQSAIAATNGSQQSQGLLAASLRLVPLVARWCSASVSGPARSGVQSVSDMVPALVSVLEGAGNSAPNSADSQVDVQALSISAAAQVLSALPSGEAAQDLERKLWPVVLAAGDVSERARRLALVAPHSIQRGVEELLNLEPAVLERLLHDTSPQSIHLAWNPADAAAAVAELVVSRRQENLEDVQMQFLASVAKGAAALGPLTGAEVEAQWSDVLTKLGKYIFVALTDIVLVDAAVQFLSVFLLGGASGRLRLDVLERKHLVSSMMLLFRDGDPACQAKVCQMLGAALPHNEHELSSGQQVVAADIAAFVNSIEQYISDPTPEVQSLLERAQQFDEEANAGGAP